VLDNATAPIYHRDMSKANTKTLMRQLSKILHGIMDPAGISPDAVIRRDRSGKLKFDSVRSWYDGDRFPKPDNFVALARALEKTPEELMVGLSVSMRFRADVELLPGA